MRSKQGQDNPIATLRGIAYRPKKGTAMIKADACEVCLNRGLSMEDRPAGMREVTLLSKEAWGQTCAALAEDLPWPTRRANLFIEGADLAAMIGREIAIGAVRIQIHGESKPCALMDQQHPGLRNALASEGRGGVYGQVIRAGTIRVGDLVS